MTIVLLFIGFHVFHFHIDEEREIVQKESWDTENVRVSNQKIKIAATLLMFQCRKCK